MAIDFNIKFDSPFSKGKVGGAGKKELSVTVIRKSLGFFEPTNMGHSSTNPKQYTIFRENTPNLL